MDETLNFRKFNSYFRKPMTFADRNASGKHVCLFGLPGNPVNEMNEADDLE